MNNLKTGLLLTTLTVLFVALGSALAGRTGAMIAFGIAVAMNIGSYWFSDKLVLRMYKAREAGPEEALELHALVADLAQRAQLPMPKVYIVPGAALNAFATGRGPEHAAVAVTEGLMQNMNRSELAGVLAHELSHIKHRDILIGSIAATVAGAIGMLASWARFGAIFGGRDSNGPNPIVLIGVALFAGLAASVVQMAISRAREFEADAGAARILGDPMPLISALQKLGFASERVPLQANQATAHMFIVNPLLGGGFAKLFSTHPPIEERISALRAGFGVR